MDDARLVARAAGGDRAAFVTLVERHRAMVYRVAFQYAGNHQDADDIAQDVFIKVLRSLGHFRQDAQFTSWLYRIAMNACIDHSRRRTPSVSLDGAGDDERVPEVAADEPGPEQQTYATELRRAVEAAVDKLPPQQRIIFTMRHFEGMKLLDIAGALGIAEGTVKRQLHSAVHRLRHVLRNLRDRASLGAETRELAPGANNWRART
ncbi:MAG TPA: sigma-70 family RNA polymerase sigma factor [Vicinamibacterales bacterium]|nr:sigma-70 family RNA polymerase sigma factor [Vicinamibacterales bacterium]